MKSIHFTVVLYLIILSIFSSCKTYKIKETTYTYEKKSVDKIESVKINFDRNIFTFFSIKSDKRYVANGSIHFSWNNNIIFTFPPHSEFEELSPFKKGYYNVKKIDSSSLVEITFKVFALGNSTEIGKIMRLDSITEIRKDSYKIFILKDDNERTIAILPENNKIEIEENTGKELIVFSEYHFKELKIPIPAKGKYLLDIYLQPKITVEMYSTTTNECYLETINPDISSQICEKELDLIQSFSFDNNCEKRFTITNSIINN